MLFACFLGFSPGTDRTGGFKRQTSTTMLHSHTWSSFTLHVKQGQVSRRVLGSAAGCDRATGHCANFMLTLQPSLSASLLRKSVWSCYGLIMCVVCDDHLCSELHPTLLCRHYCAKSAKVWWVLCSRNNWVIFELVLNVSLSFAVFVSLGPACGWLFGSSR